MNIDSLFILSFFSCRWYIYRDHLSSSHVSWSDVCPFSPSPPPSPTFVLLSCMLSLPRTLSYRKLPRPRLSLLEFTRRYLRTPATHSRTSKMASQTFKLNSGYEIPAVALGTWQSAPGEVKDAVSYAIKIGYKAIDGAYCYANEDEVGEGLKQAFADGVKREDIFVVTKLWATYTIGDDKVKEGLEKSLKSLGLDYVDLFLVHWPVAMNPNGNHDRFPTKADGSRDIFHNHSHVDTWKSVEKLLDTGKVRSIGVCNYSVKYLEELLPQAKVVPAVNQIENHPSLPQQEIVDYCKDKGIHIMAYSPLGSTGGPLLTADPVVKIAEKRGVTPSTVLLSYHVARGSTVIAKSVTPARIKANLEIVKLDDENLKELRAYSDDLTAKKELKRYVYPPFGIDFGFPDKS
ncbi:D-galacturonate reductase [Colletotrichum tanaceti]|nr:D-galacturonate reductase [Colletotrichum tanaceti]